MYEIGIVEEADVFFTQSWLRDLLHIGYVFPDLSKTVYDETFPDPSLLPSSNTFTKRFSSPSLSKQFAVYVTGDDIHVHDSVQDFLLDALQDFDLFIVLNSIPGRNRSCDHAFSNDPRRGTQIFCTYIASGPDFHHDYIQSDVKQHIRAQARANEIRRIYSQKSGVVYNAIVRIQTGVKFASKIPLPTFQDDTKLMVASNLSASESFSVGQIRVIDTISNVLSLIARFPRTKVIRIVRCWNFVYVVISIAKGNRPSRGNQGTWVDLHTYRHT
jgi:hypothetical protein